MKILMVCLGNICRSPLADGLLKKRLKEENLVAEVDSCGTSGHHEGELPDERMMKTALKNGTDLSDLRSRQITLSDLDYFDIIYVMDESNKSNVLKLCTTNEQESKIRLYLNESLPNQNKPVPDPYFGGSEGFENVYKLVLDNTEKIISKLKNNTLG